jgi:TRAP-type uncharacterized transport system substrate-binding protein
LGVRKTNSAGHLVTRLGAIALVIGVLGFLASRIDFAHDMHGMRAHLLTGEKGGSYYEIGARLAERAKERKGSIENVVSAGSNENVRRLAAASHCEIEFAFAQDGSIAGVSSGTESTTGPASTPRLVGRLAKAESVLFLGRHGDDIHEFADLRSLRIGIGPKESGTDRLARELFSLPEFRGLDLKLSNHPLAEALALAARGDLDLALLVVDADAPLVVDWVLRQGLEIGSFEHSEAVARRVAHLKTGRIGAGYYDAVSILPKTDKVVMKVETLVLANACVSRIATMDMMTLLSAEFPDFVSHNKATPNTSLLPLAPAAVDFFANEGPLTADEYAPWLVNVMPPANWAYIVMGVSLLFNAMGFGHRFRLWRIDADRVKLEDELAGFFPPSTTLGDIQRTAPNAVFTKTETLTSIQRIVGELDRLARRSRRYSLSMLVPMGQEMAYRYQEGVIFETLSVLRDFTSRCEKDRATLPTSG